MSTALYKFAGLRFWDENEIELREQFQFRIANTLKRTLTELNPAWRYFRVEGPQLTPSEFVSDEYTSDDLFITNHKKWCLRAETTASSYAMARTIQGKMPICVWQVGKSFRRELGDGATAAKLRFNEFWQLEFQCMYRVGTKADYRQYLIDMLVSEIGRFTASEVRIIESDRLPSYSESTLDIECMFKGKWKEVASCSIRTDYSDDIRVCEIAIGLDRIIEITKEST